MLKLADDELEILKEAIFSSLSKALRGTGRMSHLVTGPVTKAPISRMAMSKTPTGPPPIPVKKPTPDEIRKAIGEQHKKVEEAKKRIRRTAQELEHYKKVELPKLKKKTPLFGRAFPTSQGPLRYDLRSKTLASLGPGTRNMYPVKGLPKVGSLGPEVIRELRRRLA